MYMVHTFGVVFAACPLVPLGWCLFHKDTWYTGIRFKRWSILLSLLLLALPEQVPRDQGVDLLYRSLTGCGRQR